MFLEYIVYVSGVYRVCFWSISCMFQEYIVYVSGVCPVRLAP